MAMEIKQHLKLSQQLVMTPQLQQAIKLLQLSRIELADVVRNELLENPVLEDTVEVAAEQQRPDGHDSSSAGVSEVEVERIGETEIPVKGVDEKADTTAEVKADNRSGEAVADFDWETYLETQSNAPPMPSYRSASEDLPSLEATLTRGTSLFNHLEWQLKLSRDFTPEQEAAGRELLERHGLRQTAYALLNPGAAFGAAKCWPPERFAALCDALREQVGLWPVLFGAPGELPLLRRIASRARGPVAVCERPGTTLGSLKVLVRGARLMVCNDTGPRHYALAFGVPTVTLFGPTHQAWTDTGYAGELKLQAPVACGPCQLRACPLDHRCLTALTVDHALHAARTVLARPRQTVADVGLAPPADDLET